MTDQQIKTCRTCGGSFPLDRMTKDKKARDGRMARCKACSVEVTRRWQAANPERAAAINRRSKERNRDRARAQRKARDARLATDEEHQRKLKDRRLQRTYNVTLTWFESQLREQGGRCAICGVDAGAVTRAFSVDHDHGCCAGTRSCGQCVRGLLCGPCNLALHALDKRPDWIGRASDYLAAHRRETI